MVENKIDLIPGEPADDTAALKEFSDKNGYSGCFRTSAKTGKNIHNAMVFLIETIIKRLESAGTSVEENSPSEPKNISLEAPAPKKKDKCC